MSSRQERTMKHEIFAHLCRNGELCPSRICVDLLIVDPGDVRTAIAKLMAKGMVEARPDPGVHEVPYGLSRRTLRTFFRRQ